MIKEIIFISALITFCVAFPSPSSNPAEEKSKIDEVAPAAETEETLEGAEFRHGWGGGGGGWGGGWGGHHGGWGGHHGGWGGGGGWGGHHGWGWGK